MAVSEFPQLLSQYMRRIRASAAGVGAEIGLSRESVNNWRNGDASPGRKARDKVIACARYLRLTEAETNRLLKAADFEPEYADEVAELHAETAGSNMAAPFSVQRVFDRLQTLRPYPILMLLCPAHLGQPPMRAEILAEAGRRFGETNVLHLQPPYSLSAEPNDYFAALAAQCGFEGVESDFAFESALADRLRGTQPLFCLVSRFEQGDPVQRDVLAGILRSLSEMHSGRLYLLICGGSALADLKYQGGDLSLLNIAIAERWPEPTEADLRPRAAALGLADAAGRCVLATSGGHPLLIDEAFDLLTAQPALAESDLQESLASYPPLLQSYEPLLRDAATVEMLSGMLERQRIAAARPWIADPLLRSLYWANLILERSDDTGRWFEWRCEAVRTAGRMLVCGANPG
ncbi:hypothetical protein [Dokdonella sp.]|uniref:hypothetical protein n=1 Tax=Dokdonella sp. TaxID=2291710 RepID=UPI003C65EE3E